MAYYFVAHRGLKVTAYGPFANEHEAQIAGYFYKSMEMRDKAAREGKLRVHIMSGVNFYDAREIEVLKHSPQEFGYEKFTLKGAKALPVDPSWEKFDGDARLFVLNKDFERAR